VVLRGCGGGCPRSQQRSAATTEQRTTSKLGMKTTRRTAVCVESRPSIDALYRSVESWPSCFDRAPLGQVKNFHAKSSATDLGLKHCTRHHHLLFVKVGVAHLLREGYRNDRQQRRRIVVGQIIMYAQLFLGVAPSNPTVSLGSTDRGGAWSNGGQMKTPTEAGLQIYS
jgi:hypothetical protein